MGFSILKACLYLVLEGKTDWVCYWYVTVSAENEFAHGAPLIFWWTRIPERRNRDLDLKGLEHCLMLWGWFACCCLLPMCSTNRLLSRCHSRDPRLGILIVPPCERKNKMMHVGHRKVLRPSMPQGGRGAHTIIESASFLTAALLCYRGFHSRFRIIVTGLHCCDTGRWEERNA